MKQILILVAVMISAEVGAECINPALTPTECDFKNENTHLMINQPGWSFVRDDKIDEIIEQSQVFIDNYYATVKTTGDLAIRPGVVPMAAKLSMIEAQEVAQKAIMLANDPWSLKALLDIPCQVFWNTLAQLPGGVERTCPSTIELLTDFEKIRKLDEVRQEMLDILTNPNITLGEQWSNAAEEIRAIRDSALKSADTLGRQLSPQVLAERFDSIYRNYDELLAALPATPEQMSNARSALSRTATDTIRDHLLATGENRRKQEADIVELEKLREFSGRSVGRMQAMEIDNMLGAQKLQNWLGMKEEIINLGEIFATDLADEELDDALKAAATERFLEQDEDNPVILNDGKGYP